MQAFLIVALGAGIGGALRHGVNVGCARYCGIAFPWGTLAVNVIGSFAMGLIAGWLAFKAQAAWSQPLRLFLTTGILGGFTTFSAFSLETANMLLRGQHVQAAAYAVSSVAGSVLMLFAGLLLTRAMA